MERQEETDSNSLLSDKIFKSILNMDKKHILITILVRELLNIEVKSFEVKHPGFIVKGKNKKGEETDYYCEVNGHTITIECNKNFSKILLERNISHLRRMIVDKGFGVTQINFDNYDIENKNKLIYKYNLTGDFYSNLINIYHINLKHFTNVVKEGYNDIEKYSVFERMCMIFMAKNKEELDKITKDNVDLKEIANIIETIENDDGSEGYLNFTKHEIDLLAIKEQTEREIQLTIAKNMLDDDIDIKTISKCTGLSNEEIEALYETDRDVIKSIALANRIESIKK